MATTNIKLPPIPTLDGIKYKHYVIIQNPTNSDMHTLYLLDYEPANLSISSNEVIAYQKYGATITYNVYTNINGSGTWTKGSGKLLYTILTSGLVYNNFNLDIGEKHFEKNPMPEDGIIAPVALPYSEIPYVDVYEYKHYFITQDKTKLEKYYLYLLQYKPVYFEVDSKDKIIAFNKFQKSINCRVYDFDYSNGIWKYTSSSTAQPKYNNCKNAIVYNNYKMELEGEIYETEIFPNDGVIPAIEPEFPAIPNLHNYYNKHYVIIQNQTNLNTYHLFLINYEPQSWGVNGSYVYAYQKYGKRLDYTYYTYVIGQSEWKKYYGTLSLNITDIPVYNNTVVTIAGVTYDKNPLPNDQLSPAIEPQFPSIPCKHYYQYKHYYIIQSTDYLNIYYLYLFRNEPASFEIDEKDTIIVYDKYGSKNACENYCYTIGNTGWRSEAGVNQKHTYAAFEDALIYNNIDIDFKYRSYPKNRMPNDEVVAPPQCELPPISELLINGKACQYYFIINSTGAFEKYTLCLLEDKPVNYRVVEGYVPLVEFINSEGKRIGFKSHTYSIGDTGWFAHSWAALSYQFELDSINKSMEYCNFDITIPDPLSASNDDYLCKIPGNSFKNDGSGITRYSSHPSQTWT